MTNHWVDMVNADVVMIMGGKPAENHPIAMNWIQKTKERGAIVLQVDPRFNRTSHIADVWAKMRSGTAIAFVPYFARYAYETYVAPTRSVATIAELAAAERRDLATVLRDVVIRFDNLWQMPFPYVMALHQAPVKGEVDGFHFHIEFHPPLRRPNLLKYLAGPEIGGGNFIADTLPEKTAAELRAVDGTVHYAGV